MDEKKKWTVKDVITTVLLSAVLIVIQFVAAGLLFHADIIKYTLCLSVGEMDHCSVSTDARGTQKRYPVIRHSPHRPSLIYFMH